MIHPIAVLLVGMYFALRRDQKIERVAYVVAYIVGAEVLWRMARAEMLWEFGKYAVALIMVTALVRRRLWRMPVWPLMFLIFLLPASLMTAFSEPLGDAKDMLSFNMSGPFLLFVSCWFFSAAKMPWPKVKKMLLLIAIPIVSIAVISLFFTVMIENIKFGTESNYLTSGFFGPNQVSSMLGLGVFMSLTVFLLFRNNLVSTGLIIAASVLFAAQSMLTFSRGGIYNAVGALGMVMLFRIGDLRKSLGKLLPMIGFGLLFLLLVYPHLDDFTGGALQARFESTDTTGRAEIAEADMEIFLNNPVLGAGVGQAKELREEYFGRAIGAHTEFARIAAEHGLLGILAIIALLVGVAGRLVAERVNLVRALSAGTVAWSLLFMMNSGMRLAAPSFVLGLSFLTVLFPLRVRGVPPTAAGRRPPSRGAGPAEGGQLENS